MALDEQGGGEPALRPRRPARLLSVIVLLGISAAAIAASAVSREVVDDQEQRLLERRAAEVSALLSLSGGGLQETFRALTTVVQLEGTDAATFSAAAGPVVAAKVLQSAAIVQQDGDGYRVSAATGTGRSVGETLPPAVLEALGRAGTDGTFVTTSAFSQGGSRRLGFVTAVAGQPVRTFIYGENELTATSAADEGEDQSTRAFGDLAGALYAGKSTAADQAVLISPGFDPADPGAVTRTVRMGADEWTLAVVPTESLVGNLAERQPWLLLVGGLLTAFLVAALVEVLARRRQYAMALVNERTAELHASLEKLDAAQHQLVAQERLAAIGQLASAVGHELRNPLGVLSNVVYLLGHRLGRGDPWLDRQLRTAEREVAASTLIVSDLLQFAKPREPIYGEVDIGDLLDEVLSVAPPPPGVEVARRWPEDLPPVRADRDQLRQVLLNLVTNACDAMPDGGLLVLEAEQRDDGVRLLVADTGTGITEEDGARLFEPFFTTKSKGIGLGLAVAHRIVAEHGGELTFRSEPGGGTAFHVDLPNAELPAPAEPTPVAAS